MKKILAIAMVVLALGTTTVLAHHNNKNTNAHCNYQSYEECYKHNGDNCPVHKNPNCSNGVCKIR